MTKQKVIYYIRLFISALVLICSFLAFTTTFSFFAKFFSIQLGAGIASLIAAFSVTTLVAVLLVLLCTYLFGRFYCSLICPLGIMQDFINFATLKKSRNYKNFYKTRYTIAAIVFGALFSGWAVGFKILDPYTNFGLIASSIFSPIYNIISKTDNYQFTLASIAISLIPFIILIFLVLFRRRIFCTAICPVGTLLGLFSKYGFFRLQFTDKCITCGACFRNCPAGSINLKDKIFDNERCVRCLKCVSVCPKQAITYGVSKKDKKNTEQHFSQGRRNFVLGSVLVLGGIAAGVGGAIVRGKKFLQDTVRAILPPGAGNYNRLSSKCTSCQLCVAVCPNKVIHPRDFSHSNIYMDYSNGPCMYSCNECSKVCPTGAIKKISLQEKQHLRIGLAKIDRELCIACGICAFKCPAKALSIDEQEDGNRILVYNAAACIGCGMCQVACPHKAIEIVGIIEQTKI
ncbi:MAG: 4Fe-4S binding protein [Elusimicrobia bacterium]|nr:4Fe-4S binding protein [Elusimicrobiota bacterium]